MADNKTLKEALIFALAMENQALQIMHYVRKLRTIEYDDGRLLTIGRQLPRCWDCKYKSRISKGYC